MEKIKKKVSLAINLNSQLMYRSSKTSTVPAVASESGVRGYEIHEEDPIEDLF